MRCSLASNDRPRFRRAPKHERMCAPNILVIMADDVGWFNLSAYNHGALGYRTPGIDRIAREGALFTDWYGQSSTASGRSAFLTGQSPIRTGLTSVAAPGTSSAPGREDPNIAWILKALGYTTGQFGSNHFGERNDSLPTAHGFDEFYGNLYYEEASPSTFLEYPSDARLRRSAPRGVLHSWATAVDDATTDPLHGRIGKQRIERLGPLSQKRWETLDLEYFNAARTFIERSARQGRPWFCYINTRRLLEAPSMLALLGSETGLGEHAERMIESDAHIGELLSSLDELELSGSTIVIYTAARGTSRYAHGPTTPFRSDEAQHWEGEFRVPYLMRWPGVIAPGSVFNGIGAHEDLVPTFAAVAGEPAIVARLRHGCWLVDHACRAQLDGHDLGGFLAGHGREWPRRAFFYWSEQGELLALRVNNVKLVYEPEYAQVGPWQTSLGDARIAYLYDIKSDVFERRVQASRAQDAWTRCSLLSASAQSVVAQQLETFEEFPPRHQPARTNLARVMEQMTLASAQHN